LLQQLQSGENIHIVLNPMDQQKPPETDQPVGSKNPVLAPNSNLPKEEDVSRIQTHVKSKVEAEGAGDDLARILATDSSSQDQIEIPEIKDWTQEQVLVPSLL